MTHHTRSTHHWTAALPLLVIDAGLLLVLSLIVLLHPGPSPVSAVASQSSPTPIATVAAMPPAPSSTPATLQVAPTGAPSPSPSPNASPRPTPSAHPAAPAVVPTCRVKDLSARILAWDGAAGSRIAELELRNAGTAACNVATPTALRLVAGDGSVLIDSTTIADDPSTIPEQPALTVAPGASVRTDVRVANYCGPTPKGPIRVSLSLPGSGGTVVAMDRPGVSSADAVPPCNGPIGPEIEMSGWRR
jgi:hypothetical protein